MDKRWGFSQIHITRSFISMICLLVAKNPISQFRDRDFQEPVVNLAKCPTIIITLWLVLRLEHSGTFISQIPQCIRQISHNASFCSRNVHTYAHFCYKAHFCHKSNNASDKYPIMHHFVREMCTQADFCHKTVHYGIQDWCIVGFVQQV